MTSKQDHDDDEMAAKKAYEQVRPSTKPPVKPADDGRLYLSVATRRWNQI